MKTTMFYETTIKVLGGPSPLMATRSFPSHPVAGRKPANAISFPPLLRYKVVTGTNFHRPKKAVEKPVSARDLTTPPGAAPNQALLENHVLATRLDFAFAYLYCERPKAAAWETVVHLLLWSSGLLVLANWLRVFL